MKNKFLLKTIGMTAAVAVTIGGIGVYNYNSEAVAGTSSVSDKISTETNTSVKEETKSTAKIPSGKAEKEEISL